MTADFSLNGQVALVTGASSGLGRSFAGFLADAGASVIVAARRAEKCAKVAEEIGGETLAVGMDVTVCFDDVTEEVTLPKFQPAKEAP